MSNHFVVSARKYRPVQFKELLGQDAVSYTLKRSILQNKIAHAYLFCGPRGVGKTSAARIFAKSINCLSPSAEGEACGICESCKAFEEQRSFNIYELDAASNNSTEDIRRLINEVSVPPQLGRYKVYIIDEVHMLSSSAFNAFLKTLEEPPSYVVFILATTEKQKILPTILSRCQVFDFKPIPNQIIVGQLTTVAEQEGIPTDLKALEMIAQKAEGGMRDALSLFDRIASFGNGRISTEHTAESLHILSEDNFFSLVDYIITNNYSAILFFLDQLLANGFDAKTILVGMQDFCRNLLFAYDPTTLAIANINQSNQNKFVQLAQKVGRSFLFKAIHKLSEAEKNYRTSSAKRLLLEMTILGLTNIASQDAAVDSLYTQSKEGSRGLEKKNTPHSGGETASFRLRNTPSSSTTFSTMEKTSSKEDNDRSEKDKEPPLQSREKTLSISSNSPQKETQPVFSSYATHSFSLRKNMDAPTIEKRSVGEVPKEVSSISLQNDTNRKENIKEENIAAAWRAYGEEKVPQAQVFFRNTFLQRLPKYKEEGLLEITPISLAEKTYLQENKDRILSFLEKYLGCSHLSLHLCDVVENKMEYKSNSQWFQERKEQNKALKLLSDKLNLQEY